MHAKAANTESCAQFLIPASDIYQYLPVIRVDLRAFAAQAFHALRASVSPVVGVKQASLQEL
jgi:hypothetical protein